MAEKLYEPGRVPKGVYKGFVKDYTLSDMQVVYRRGEWKNWNGMLAWLKKYGRADNKLTPGEAAGLAEDVQCLKKEKVPFTSSPRKAFALAHPHRKPIPMARTRAARKRVGRAKARVLVHA